MHTNVGTVDRVIRTLVGLGLLYLAYVNQTSWRWLAAAGAALALATAAVRFCPTWWLLRIKTLGREASRS
jgi:Protein of unknown function (DUF2892)